MHRGERESEEPRDGKRGETEKYKQKNGEMNRWRAGRQMERWKNVEGEG